MSSAKQKILENERWPHVKRNWIKAIKAIINGGVYSKKNISGGTSDPTGDCGGGFYEFRSDNKGFFINDKVMKGFRIPRVSESSQSGRLTDEQENEIAENIYDWWTSGKGYHQWYNEKFRQQTLNF